MLGTGELVSVSGAHTGLRLRLVTGHAISRLGLGRNNVESALLVSCRGSVGERRSRDVQDAGASSGLATEVMLQEGNLCPRRSLKPSPSEPT